MSRIAESIQKLLQKHRVLIWYDQERAFTDEFENLNIEGINKVTLDRDELAVKVRVLLDQPDDKFVLYIPRAKPTDEENWLLDLELAYHVYYTDQASLFLQELELGYHYKNWITQHLAFFQSRERLLKFKEIANETDGDRLLSMKIMQVVLRADTTSPDSLLRKFAEAFANKSNSSLEVELKRYGLWDLFWDEVGRHYGYEQKDPGIYGFLLDAFRMNFKPLADQSSLNAETRVMLSAWKDTLSFQEAFRTLSSRIQKDLNIESVLNSVALDEILHDDVFDLIDRRIIHELVRGMVDESLDSKRLESAIKTREFTYWYDLYRPFYEALNAGHHLLEAIRSQEKIEITVLADGIRRYTGEWFRIDQYYRRFIEWYRATGQNSVLNPLYVLINKAYSNTWLLNLSDSWQRAMDDSGKWSHGTRKLTSFYREEVQPYLSKKIRVFVIISDALRYECGESLHQIMQKENRFDSSLDFRITALPSYTQLGMASLLPHQKLAFGKSDDVLADGLSTVGLQRRSKVLAEHSGVNATAVSAEQLMKLNTKSEEARSLVSSHELIYVYHDRIDSTGDDTASENLVIEAARDEIEFLVKLVKKISNLGVYHILVTADHGFVYQNEPLDESDFADAQIEGDIIKSNRRFVLGRNLRHKANVSSWSAQDFGIEGDVQILIPKSINRLRRQGSGSRYVHGGATLQEITVPVVRIKKLREDTVEKVDVDVLNKHNNLISTNLHRVRFYQQSPVSETVAGRSIKAQFKAKDGTLLSDVWTWTFNSDSKNAADREFEHRFQLSAKASTEYKNQTIYLEMEEQIEGTNSWVPYRKYPFTINISFARDFDDF